MHGQCIYSGPITSTFSAIRFDENLFTCRRKKEDRKAFQISHFYWLFLSDIVAVKGLIKKNLKNVSKH